jgi:hypothetical protein
MSSLHEVYGVEDALWACHFRLSGRLFQLKNYETEKNKI